VLASRLLRKVKVQARIAELQSELHRALDARNLIDAQWIEDQLVENVKRAMQAKPVLDREGKETGEYTYNGAVANRALELLGKQRGMFGDKLELAVTPEQARAGSSSWWAWRPPGGKRRWRRGRDAAGSFWAYPHEAPPSATRPHGVPRALPVAPGKTARKTTVKTPWKTPWRRAGVGSPQARKRRPAYEDPTNRRRLAA
jgi:hypothetical protein